MALEILRTIIAALIVAATIWVAVPDKVYLTVKGDVVIDQRGGMGASRR